MLRRVRFWHLSSGGAIAKAEFWELGSGGHAMIVSVWLRSFGWEIIVIHANLYRCTWPRTMTCSLWSKLSSSISDDKWNSPVSSCSSMPHSLLVSSSFFGNAIRGSSHLQYHTRSQTIGGEHFLGNTDWLLCWMWVLSLAVLLGCSVNSDDSPDWTLIPFAIMKIESWGMWERV